MIHVTLNGEAIAIEQDGTVADLLHRAVRFGPAIAVELNGEIVARMELGQRRLTSGDVLEVVTLVGGG